jgi:hypothetical protein
MQHKINRLLIVIAIAAFGMISAPTLSAMNVVFAASFDPFGQLKSFGLDKLGLDKLGLDKVLKKSTKNNDNNNQMTTINQNQMTTTINQNQMTTINQNQAIHTPARNAVPMEVIQKTGTVREHIIIVLKDKMIAY